MDDIFEDEAAPKTIAERFGEPFAKIYAELVEKFGEEELDITETKLGPIVVRTPTRGEYKRFRSQIKANGDNGELVEQLGRTAVVFPSRTEFDAILNRRPALADVIGNKALELAGGVSAKKK